jgi:hypothetical protein
MHVLSRLSNIHIQNGNEGKQELGMEKEEQNRNVSKYITPNKNIDIQDTP